jgi:hypothetical protein
MIGRWLINVGDICLTVVGVLCSTYSLMQPINNFSMYFRIHFFRQAYCCVRESFPSAGMIFEDKNGTTQEVLEAILQPGQEDASQL